MLDRLTGQQAQEVRLAGAVRADDGHALAVADEQVERIDDVGEVQAGALDDLPARLPPVRRIRIRCRLAGAGGGPASTNFLQRVSAACAWLALLSLMAARCFMV